MLLNEFLKEHRKVEQQEAEIRALEARAAELEDLRARLGQVEKFIEANKRPVQ